MSSEMPELLPCLRCGGPAETVLRWFDHPALASHPPTYFPGCRHCGLTSGSGFDSPESADNLWNYRADLARAQIRREVVEEIVAYLAPRLCDLCERGFTAEKESDGTGWMHYGPRGAFKGYCAAAHVHNLAEQEAKEVSGDE